MKVGKLINSQHWCAEDGRACWLCGKRLFDAILRARPLYLYSGLARVGRNNHRALRRMHNIKTSGALRYAYCTLRQLHM